MEDGTKSMSNDLTIESTGRAPLSRIGMKSPVSGLWGILFENCTFLRGLGENNRVPVIFVVRMRF